MTSPDAGNYFGTKEGNEPPIICVNKQQAKRLLLWEVWPTKARGMVRNVFRCESIITVLGFVIDSRPSGDRPDCLTCCHRELLRLLLYNTEIVVHPLIYLILL